MTRYGTPSDCLAAVEQSCDVWMAEVGKDLHLIAEAFANRFAAEAGFDQLDRDLLAIVLVVALREIDGAHAAVTDLAQDLVWTDPRPVFSCAFVDT